MKSISHTYRDGMTSEWSLWESDQPSAPLLLIFPALGVRASYYEGLAAAFHQAGWNVCTADYRGMGASSVRASRKVDYGYEVLIEDTKEVCQELKRRLPEAPLYLMGHSLGGQVSSLMASRYPELLAGLILPACSFVDPKGWPKGQRWQTWLAVHLFPLLSHLVGHFPGKQVGFGGREGRSLMLDWARSGRTGRYQLRQSRIDDEAQLGELRLKTLVLTFEGDTFAPPDASKNLYRKFHPEAAITHHHLTSKEMDANGLDHFKWTRFPEVIIQQVAAWR